MVSGAYGNRTGCYSYWHSHKFNHNKFKTIIDYLHDNNYYTCADVPSDLIMPRRNYDEYYVSDESSIDLKTHHYELLCKMKKLADSLQKIFLYLHYSGIHEGISDGGNIDTSSLVSSLSNASDMAYSSVHDPVEGTMLTVLREVAKEASLQSKAGASICEAFDPLVEAAYISVNQTPDQLPVLKEGGVVDSGGYGIEILLRGMALGLAGKDPKIAPLHLRYPKGDGIKHMIDSHHEKDDLYGYCTQFVLTSSDSKKKIRTECS